MPKPLWVLLPLLAAAALIAWAWLRRRRPGRLALNIGFSLLLLGYVLTTAGLGIFWVANQQLPVFDWHYLFGYATLLVLALHLAFNARTVWRFFVRPRVPAAAVRQPAPPTRRVFGIAAALLGIAAAYALGLRQGRQALAPRSPGAAPAAGGDEALAAVERFHALSSNSRRGVLRAPGVDWGDAPAPFKRLATQPALRLPSPQGPLGAGFDLQALATLLWHVAGITEQRGGLRLRASPSSGALFATELYVATASVAGLAPGLWHYDAAAHGLQPLPLPAGSSALDMLAAATDGSARGAAALVVATAVFRRSGHKYRDRTYRYVLADLGHALENLRIAALRCAAWPQFVPGFDDARCAEVLQLDAAEEGVLALIALRSGDAPAAPDPAAAWQAAAPSDAHALGPTGTMHVASSLRRGAGAPALPAAPAPAATTAPPATALPAPAPADAARLALIAQRRSRRRFAAEPLALPQLAGVLAALAAPPMLLPGQTLHVDLVVHAVDGLAPGAYRYDAQRHALQPRRVGARLRDAARAAALDQDVIGDAAVVFVLAIDRAALRHAALGPARAYRHALLHAGCIGERIYLQAEARGLGACAVGAFHDDEASALVAADASAEWIVHFAALGRPAH